MVRTLIFLLLVLLGPGKVWAGPSRMPAEHVKDTPGPSSAASPWPGGPSSLPYNMPADWRSLRDRALALPGVNEMIIAFQARGYVRRADRDTAYTQFGRSGAVLSFEIPGVPIDVRQPVVIVHSQAVHIVEAGGWFPITVVGGMVAKDSVVGLDHVPVLDRSLGSEPMLVIQRLQTSAGIISTEDAGAPYKAYYTMRELSDDPIGAIRRFLPTVSQQTAQWWYGLCDRVERGAMAGLISGGLVGTAGGARGMGRGMLWGTLAGGISEAANYIFEHYYDD